MLAPKEWHLMSPRRMERQSIVRNGFRFRETLDFRLAQHPADEFRWACWRLSKSPVSSNVARSATESAICGGPTVHFHLRASEELCSPRSRFVLGFL